MPLWNLWAHGTTIGVRPFAYFSPLLSLIAFIIVVFILTALEQVIDNKDQHVLW